MAEVRAKDVVQAGVAVRVLGEEIHVCPYVFRQVCRNGAIRRESSPGQLVRRLELGAGRAAVEAVVDRLRCAVQACAACGTFPAAVAEMRSATEWSPLPAFAALPRVLNLPHNRRSDVLGSVWTRYTAGGDHSLFGLMNAVTAVARDERDPLLRWRLEEAGGRIPRLTEPVQDLEFAAAGGAIQSG
jgi:hypothetical protein